MAIKRRTAKRRVAAKKKPVARTKRVSVKRASPRRRITKRYTSSGKMDFKKLAIDAAATIAGAVVAGIGGQALAKQGVDSKISGIAPVLLGGILALKGKHATMKAAGIGMIVAAGISVVNNITKSTALLSGADDGLDSLDLYSNPHLLGIPIDNSPVYLGIPIDNSSLSGSEWQTGCSVN